MLQNLHVKNLALIDEIEVEFQDGLNILTGETGAGKSILLGSVNLALGGRYTKDMIRQGADYGLVELAFFVKGKEQKVQLEEMDIYPDDGMITLSRRLMDGRSICRINGETVNMSTLKAVASILIDIHGQHEHQSLLYKKNHLGIVDAFAKETIHQLKEDTKKAYKNYVACRKSLEEADMDEGQRAKEMSFLQFEIDEIENANLQVGEDEELESLFRKMEHGKKIADSTASAYAFTSDGQENASDSIGRAIRYLGDVMSLDEKAGQLYEQLSEIDNLLNDFNHELASYNKSCEFSDEEYHETETRLNEINRLKTKYGNRIEDILSYLETQQEKLQQMEDYDQYLMDLKRQLAKAEEELGNVANKLTKERKTQAKILEEEITNHLQDLNFADIRFVITFEKLDHYTSEGVDDVEFLISLNPGQPLLPLADVASGGELSRVMLAIKTVMADRDAIETLIFDEIDTGISGRTAQKVSEKMAVIGREHQVLCITHLAQIAAMADSHYLIEKQVDKNTTKTVITLLKKEESVYELARILGGAQITDTVVQNAKEMKELAKQMK